MSKEQTTEKVLVFNPGGVVLKVLFSIGFIVLAAPKYNGEGVLDFINYILSFVMVFVIWYAFASLFGFAVRATGNYLIGGILFLVLLVAFFAFFDKVNAVLTGLGGFGELLMNVIIIAVLALPVVSDVRKTILYLKHAA